MPIYTLPPAYNPQNTRISGIRFIAGRAYVSEEDEAGADLYLLRYYGCTKSVGPRESTTNLRIAKRPDVLVADTAVYADINAATAACNAAGYVDGRPFTKGTRVLFSGLTVNPNIYTYHDYPPTGTFMEEPYAQPLGGDQTTIRDGTSEEQIATWNGQAWIFGAQSGLATSTPTSNDRGNWDASGNVLPATSSADDEWTISVGGTIPGPPPVTVSPGDKVKALVDNASATDPSQWTITPAAAAVSINRRTIVAGAGATVEAAWNAQGIVVGSLDQITYVYNGVSYLYNAPTGTPSNASLAAHFIGGTADTPTPETLQFPTPHGLPTPLMAPMPFFIQTPSGNLQRARAVAGEVPEFVAISVVDANTVAVAAANLVELPADIAPLPNIGITQFVDETTPGALTETEPTISAPVYTLTGDGRKAKFHDWRPINTAPATPTSTLVFAADATARAALTGLVADTLIWTDNVAGQTVLERVTVPGDGTYPNATTIELSSTPTSGWVDSTDGVNAAIGDQIRILDTHVIVLPSATATAGQAIRFAPGNSPPDWPSLTGSFDPGGVNTVGNGQVGILAGAEIATAVFDGVSNWRIFV